VLARQVLRFHAAKVLPDIRLERFYQRVEWSANTYKRSLGSMDHDAEKQAPSSSLMDTIIMTVGSRCLSEIYSWRQLRGSQAVQPSSMASQIV
jgi:hypothetical protein